MSKKNVNSEEQSEKEMSQDEGKMLVDLETDFFKDLLEKKQVKQLYKKYGLTLLYSLPDEDMILYERELNIKPQTAVDFYNHGTYYAQKKNLSQAIKFFTKSVDLDSEFPPPHFNLALAYKAAKDTRRANKEWENFIALEEKRLKKIDKLDNDLPEGEIDWLKEAREHKEETKKK